MKLNSDQRRRCQCQFNFPPRYCVPIFFLLITPARPFASKFCVPNFWDAEFCFTKMLCSSRIRCPMFWDTASGPKALLNIAFSGSGRAETARTGRKHPSTTAQGEGTRDPPPNQDGPRDGHPARPGGAAPRAPADGRTRGRPRVPQTGSPVRRHGWGDAAEARRGPRGGRGRRGACSRPIV